MTLLRTIRRLLPYRVKNLRQRISRYTMVETGTALPAVLAVATLVIFGFVALLVARNVLRVVSGL